MNKTWFHILFFLLINAIAHGQVRFEREGGSGYLQVNSYSGAVSQSDIVTLRISGNGNVTLEDWKISARIVDYPVVNGGNIFPEDKVSLSPTRTTGTLAPGPIPSVSQIGMPLSVPFLNGPNEVYLVPKSNAPIVNDSPNQSAYFSFVMGFNLTVAPGSYLNALQPWKEYSFQIEYTLYDQNNTPIGRDQFPLRIFVRDLGDPPPEENQYSIRVSTDAINGLLEFKTMDEYINGKSVTYTNGLSVSATTAYQVRVKSIPEHFSSASGNTLPLDVVHVQLDGGSGTKGPVTLSADSFKTILEGASTGGAIETFNITYFTGANDSRLFNVPSEQYETSLMYEISPR